LKVIVASKNPVKISATKIAFEKVFSNETFEFESVSVSSEVSDQPTSGEETLKGAINRVNNASKLIDAAYYVGLEGGIEKINEEMKAFAWIVVKNNNLIGKAKTGTFFLPKQIAKLIDQGKELGEADDIVFKKKNSKQKNGSVGILTNNIIDRKSYYSEAVVLALIPFKNLELYNES
jgi:inosine/xanthosine triphosphatase